MRLPLLRTHTLQVLRLTRAPLVNPPWVARVEPAVGEVVVRLKVCSCAWMCRAGSMMHSVVVSSYAVVELCS